MRAALDEMLVSLRESLSQMVDALDRLLVAAYATPQAHRFDLVAEQQRKMDRDTVAMEALVIDVLATQQPVVATDLSVVKGLLVASRELGHIAHEQRDLAHLMDQLGIQDPQLPPEVVAVLPDLRKVMADSVTAFLQDDRVLAESTFERLRQLGLTLQAVPSSPYPPTVVPVTQLHLFALGRILAGAGEIARSAPIYRYVSAPA